MGDSTAFWTIVILSSVLSGIAIAGVLAAIAARLALTRTLEAEARVARAITNWWRRVEGKRVPGAGSEPEEHIARAARYARQTFGPEGR